MAAVALLSAVQSADAQWRATAWTMDFTNDTDACIALSVGEEGSPPIDAADVKPHRGQHFDDNHTNVVVHAKVYERADCSGRIVADLHDRVHQVRNILTVVSAGSGYTLRRQPTPEAIASSGLDPAAVAASTQTDGENFLAGPAYRVGSVAVAKVRLGDDARAVEATAATGTSQRTQPREIAFLTRDGGDVTVQLRAGRAWNITYKAQTPTPASAARFARAALQRYGWKPTTQVSGAFILLRYCAIAGGKSAPPAPVTCDRAAPMLEVRAAVPESYIELRT